MPDEQWCGKLSNYQLYTAGAAVPVQVQQSGRRVPMSRYGGMACIGRVSAKRRANVRYEHNQNKYKRYYSMFRRRI